MYLCLVFLVGAAAPKTDCMNTTETLNDVARACVQAGAECARMGSLTWPNGQVVEYVSVSKPEPKPAPKQQPAHQVRGGAWS